MCWCQPNVRTPNCGSVACTAAAAAVNRSLDNERADVIAFLRSEAERMRRRNEGADAAVAAHVDLLVDRIGRGDHRGARHSRGKGE